MKDLMTLMESRLRELYDFDNLKPTFVAQKTIYLLRSDHNALKFLSAIVDFDYKKIEQIKNLNNLIKSIRGEKDFSSYGIGVSFEKYRLSFSFYDRIRIDINSGQTLEDLSIMLYRGAFSVREIQDGSAYEQCYAQKLKEFNLLIPSDITLSEFNLKKSSNINDIIRSSIIDNSLTYIDEKTFIEKYSNQYSVNNKKIAVFHFGLKPAEIRLSLEPFFSKEKINQIVVILSHFAFFAMIEDPNLLFNDLRGYISLADCKNKFNKHYDCYHIGIHDLKTIRNRSIAINTDNYFISYNKVDNHHLNFVTGKFAETRFEGIESVYAELRSDIATVFKRNLDIEQNSISNQDVDLVKMMNF